MKVLHPGVNLCHSVVGFTHVEARWTPLVFRVIHPHAFLLWGNQVNNTVGSSTDQHTDVPDSL